MMFVKSVVACPMPNSDVTLTLLLMKFLQKKKVWVIIYVDAEAVFHKVQTVWTEF